MNDEQGDRAPSTIDRVPSTNLTERPDQRLAETPLPDIMEELAKLIGQPARAPAMGLDAAAKVQKCFEVVADDVDAIAADRVNAALELQQEARTYSTVLREAGKVLAAKVEAESARAYKLSLVLRETRAMIATDVEAAPAAPPIAETG